MLFGCFAAVFLRLKQFHPTIYKLNAAVIGWNIAICALILCAFQYVVGSLVGFAILPEPILYGALWYASYVQWKKQLHPLANWYFGLWSIQIAANLVPVLTIPLKLATPLLPYTFEFVGAIHSIALTAAVSLHMRHAMQQDQLARIQAKTKGEFLARMSHEIRTPMNGILGMSELLRDGPLSPTQRQYNEIIYSSASSLLTIINDILDFSKIEAGKLQLENIPFDLRRLAADSLALLRPLIEQKDIELLCDISPDTPTWVQGDPTRIRQILINYLSNAVKFTESGEIGLRIEMCANDQIRFSVNDTGCGVPHDAESRLFNSFEQADNSISRKYGGTGLGLAICKQLAELMHGSVGMDNRASGGATFWVQLPLAPSPNNDLLDRACNHRDWVATLPSTLHTATTQCALTILVVEDNLTNQVVVRAMLERLGHRVTVVDNGREGINTALARHDEFDLVLMDCEMPVLSGKEATRQIRLEEHRRNVARLPIFALTAATLPEQIRACVAAGMDGHFAKPISMQELRNLLATLPAAKIAGKTLATA
jgi:signal transduction histidine kinase/CheY-like chemotaxis protein